MDENLPNTTRLRLTTAVSLTAIFSAFSIVPAAAAEESSCGYPPVYDGELVSFTHEVEFTVEVGRDQGYLIDCLVGADALLLLDSKSGGIWTYEVYGYLGDYE